MARPKVQRISKMCLNCSAQFEDIITGNRKFCSRSCSTSGKFNPNFNNKWTNEQRQIQSIKIRNIVDDDYRHKCALANLNKKFSKERINKMHAHRNASSYSHSHTNESKILIGLKSKAKFTEEYNLKYRQTMYNSGKWINPDSLEDFQLYKKLAAWSRNMWDILIEDECKLNLAKHGIYNIKHNKTGMTRDHKISILYGFNNKIFPEIIRHPCNLQLLTLSQNLS